MRVLTCGILVWLNVGAVAKGQEMAFPERDWAEAAPAAHGLDAAKLEAALAYLAQHTGKDGTRQMLIVRRGRVVWRGPDVDVVHGVWSATKSFTSTVLGLLIDDGKCRLDTPAHQFVPALKETYAAVTLRHFATMTSGYRAVGDEPQGTYRHGPSKTPFMPGMPLFAPPGSRYAYWDSALNQFGHVLTRAAGKPMAEVFRERVAGPIGMDPRKWSWGELAKVDGLVVNGGSGNTNKHVQISARELARLGHLFLNGGKWGEKQLISRAWVEMATSVHVPADCPWAHPESEIDGRGVYGLGWWRNGVKADGERLWPGAPAGTFAASGFNNNKCFVVPEWQMVVVRLGLDGNVKAEVWSGFFARLGEAVQAK